MENYTYKITDRRGKEITLRAEFDSETAAERFLRLVNDCRYTEIAVYRHGDFKPVMLYFNPLKQDV